MTPQLLKKMSGAATELGRLLRYEGAGTVEFIVDAKSGGFYFLEVNTRVQVGSFMITDLPCHHTFGGLVKLLCLGCVDACVLGYF